MTFEETKAQELGQKLRAFTAAVDKWLEVRRAAPEFKIHRSQMVAIEAVLQGMRENLAGLIQGEALLARASGIEESILAGYQIWEFYRQKFAQRLEEQFRKHLRIADELAWACYKPVRDAAFGETDRAKEPPLVFLNAGWSPFLKERDSSYKPDAVPSALLKSNKDFQQAVASLPFPLIGIPWYQAGFLPGALTIAHEVGHAVEADCGLSNEMEAAVQAAVGAQDRVDDWLAWRSEMFADAYGCLCLGPAFVHSLVDTLTGDRGMVESSMDPEYPPLTVRIRLNCEMLGELKHKDAAAAIWAAWVAQYAPESHKTYEADCVGVAKALLGVKVARAKGAPTPLRRLIEFSGEADQRAKEFAPKVMAGSTVQQQKDVRLSFAAVEYGFRHDASTFAAAGSPRFVEWMYAACSDELRSGEKQGAGATKRTDLLAELGRSLVRRGSVNSFV